MANRNLLRCKNATDRRAGILGVCLAGTQEFVAFPEMDGGDGTPRPSQAKEFVSLLAGAGGRGALQHDKHFTSLACPNDLRGGGAVGGNL
jgi:hypothetical protein